jgi:deoxyxylulose-5-phosphate synthase
MWPYLAGKINSMSPLGNIELIQLNHDNVITDVGHQIKSSYHHKIIYSPNQIFLFVQIQLAK